VATTEAIPVISEAVRDGVAVVITDTTGGIMDKAAATTDRVAAITVMAGIAIESATVINAIVISITGMGAIATITTTITSKRLMLQGPGSFGFRAFFSPYPDTFLYVACDAPSLE
jgi:hypothetical protein